MAGNETFVVLIGVDHYENLPASAQLRGPTRDVHAWSEFVQHSLGVDGTLVRLESPRGPSATGLATVENVAVALGEMHQWLKDHPEGTGILMFSGHGATAATTTDREGDQLRLCLQDFELGERAHTTSIGIGQINHALGDAASRVTIITDCCYTDFGVASGLSGTQHAGRLTARLLLGSGEFSPAYSVQVQGRWMGLFTHALITSLELWRTQTEGGVRYVMGSYEDITFRARALIATMGFPDQQPVCSGGPFVASLPFNYPATTAPRSALSLQPNLPRRRREVSGEMDIPTVWLGAEASGNGSPCFVLVEAPFNQDVSVSGPPASVTAGQTCLITTPSFLTLLQDPTAMNMVPVPNISGDLFNVDLDTLLNNSGQVYNAALSAAGTWTATSPTLSSGSTVYFSLTNCTFIDHSTGAEYALPATGSSVPCAFMCVQLSDINEIVGIYWAFNVTAGTFDTDPLSGQMRINGAGPMATMALLPSLDGNFYYSNVDAPSS